ncbi:hypothetical protein PtB15_5B93 [Puccinia triticina]|nr:hypothetical protein PtB15_5B93 [Puccinia triticina]
MGLTNHCENLVNALGYHSDIIFGKPFGAMSARLSHLNNSNGALSADARPQFPTLRLLNREWRQANSTAPMRYQIKKKTLQVIRFTQSRPQPDC